MTEHLPFSAGLKNNNWSFSKERNIERKRMSEKRARHSDGDPFPTTEEVRMGWAHFRTRQHVDPAQSGAEAEEEFNQMLDAERAAAWVEGLNAGISGGSTPNPYQH